MGLGLWSRSGDLSTQGQFFGPKGVWLVPCSFGTFNPNSRPSACSLREPTPKTTSIRSLAYLRPAKVSGFLSPQRIKTTHTPCPQVVSQRCPVNHVSPGGPSERHTGLLSASPAGHVPSCHVAFQHAVCCTWSTPTKCYLLQEAFSDAYSTPKVPRSFSSMRSPPTATSHLLCDYLVIIRP